MIIGDEIETLVLSLKLKLLPHRPEEVAYMKPAGRLDTRKNSQADLLETKKAKNN